MIRLTSFLPATRAWARSAALWARPAGGLPSTTRPWEPPRPLRAPTGQSPRKGSRAAPSVWRRLATKQAPVQSTTPGGSEPTPDGLVTEVGAGTARVRGGRRGRDPPGGGVPSPLARTIPGRIARPRSPPSGPWEMRGASEGGEGEVCAVGSAAVSRPSREVLRQIRGSPCGRALEPEPTGGCGRGGRLGPVGRTPTPLARPEAEP